MEKEADIYHLLLEHQIALFFVSAVILLGLVLGVGIIVGRALERRRRSRKEKPHKT